MDKLGYMGWEVDQGADPVQVGKGRYRYKIIYNYYNMYMYIHDKLLSVSMSISYTKQDVCINVSELV